MRAAVGGDKPTAAYMAIISWVNLSSAAAFSALNATLATMNAKKYGGTARRLPLENTPVVVVTLRPLA
jgi:hypothetical protein